MDWEETGRAEGGWEGRLGWTGGKWEGIGVIGVDWEGDGMDWEGTGGRLGHTGMDWEGIGVNGMDRWGALGHTGCAWGHWEHREGGSVILGALGGWPSYTGSNAARHWE